MSGTLGATLQDNITGKAVQPENMLHHKFSSFISSEEFGKKNKMSFFRRPVNYGE